MWYNYIYLDPNKPGNFIYDDVELKYEPFYVGKGMGTRYYGHLNDKTGVNEHKTNKINNILKKIPKEKYKMDFIFVFNFSENELDVLNKEKDLIEKIGTVVNVPNVLKRGPLLNLMEGGKINPVLIGEDNGMFGKSIIDVWKEKYSEEETKEKYDKWIKNLSGRTPRLGIKHTDETKKKISKKHKGQMTGEKNPMYKKSYHTNGLKKRSSEIKGKCYEEIYGHEKSKDIKEKISKTLTGRKMSDDTKEKLRIKNIGRVFSKEHNKKISESKKGSKLSDEHKQKLSFLNKGKKNNMFGQGHKVSGSKNGRAVIYIIHTSDNIKYLCNGTFKKLCEEVLSNYKPLPHRKYLKESLEKNTTINGWYFKKLKSLEEININDYIIYN